MAKKMKKVVGTGKHRQVVEVDHRLAAAEPDEQVGQYELLAGQHRDHETGELYDATTDPGVVVESRHPLDTLFGPNKFKRLDGAPRRKRDYDETLDQSGKVMDRAVPKEDDEDEDDDFTVAAEKRRRSRPALVQTNPSDAEDAEDGEEDVGEPDPDTDPAEKEAEDKSQFGKEVTGEFQTAARSDLKVFYKKKGGFTVVDADEPDTPLKDGLKDKKAVNRYLDAYRKPQ